jgi:hypothetical protein
MSASWVAVFVICTLAQVTCSRHSVAVEHGDTSRDGRQLAQIRQQQSTPPPPPAGMCYTAAVTELPANHLQILLAVAAIHSDKLAWPADLTPGWMWDRYHNYSELTAFLSNLDGVYRHVKVYSIGTSFQGRHLWVAQLTGDVSSGKPPLARRRKFKVSGGRGVARAKGCVHLSSASIRSCTSWESPSITSQHQHHSTRLFLQATARGVAT